MAILSEELPWADLGRWFAGELPADEAEALARWVAATPQRAANVAALREAWIAAGAAGEQWDAAAAIVRVHRAADETAVVARLGQEPSVMHVRRPVVSRLVLRAAAVLAVLAGGGLLVARTGGRDASPRAADFGADVKEYRAARGQRLALRLPDGTQVVLAPSSVLRRSANYGREARRLELEGEAYFTVTHDAARPFTVHTRRFIAHDLGTRFVVQAYPDEPVSELLVTEGKVALRRGAAAPVILTQQKRARVDADRRIVIDSIADADIDHAWTRGELVFSDTPLDEVARTLERWYDVDVRLASPPLARLRVSGVFGSQPIADELGVVARALGLSVRRVDNGYELSAIRS